MLVGVPAEVKDSERRVALTPEGVRELAAHGHRVVAVSYTHLTLPTNREV